MKSLYLRLDQLVQSVLEEIKSEVQKKSAQINIASIICGDNPSSISYLNGMKKKAENIGIKLDIIQLDSNITEKAFLKEVEKYNNDASYSGIIVQVPLPDEINFHKLALTLDYKKDIDGITPYNQGLLFSQKPFILPATALAVEIALKYISNVYNYSLKGKNAAIIGRSLTVGKPVSHLLLKHNMTPTIIHTRSVKPQKITSQADIIVACCGVPELITKDWIKKGAVVIDVGIHSIYCDSKKGYKMFGDVNSKSALKKSSILTAVPGGIGNLTSALIFANALKCWYKLNEDKNFLLKFEE